MPDPIRLNGMSHAASALQMMERRQQVLANNLANASTRGFKAETAFARVMDNALASTGTALDTTAGSLTETHNVLDVAVKGDGYFVTQTPGGERFTRDGSFQLDTDRRLVDSRGNAVLGDDGPIQIRNGKIEIEADGSIKVDGHTAGRIRLERVANGSELEHEGGTQFVPNATRQVIPANERHIQQGFVEESNVNTMSAMTSMIDVLHRYGSAQKTLSTIDSVRAIATTELGKPI
jgi:flagellar basal body rod protein FlgG